MKGRPYGPRDKISALRLSCPTLIPVTFPAFPFDESGRGAMRVMLIVNLVGGAWILAAGLPLSDGQTGHRIQFLEFPIRPVVTLNRKALKKTSVVLACSDDLAIVVTHYRTCCSIFFVEGCLTCPISLSGTFITNCVQDEL
ncbi:hypothetical protein DAPPUDRAFT_108507 [Daphnia pulex]|uniref:Uncharacterized protein n=1 Tax=Daphnia pulex TaxID=6669 RepID=E9H0D8_DAPPU|nr:hypothetical protein DAPPUDRAFT_108507 [Daphnia pulex]|eukprot:EFX74837.1 hypothetical protein DAPPUDRAFT_108507 [Daphnia pulex]